MRVALLALLFMQMLTAMVSVVQMILTMHQIASHPTAML